MMTGLLIVCVLLGSCCHVAADEADPAPNATRVVAKIKFVEVRQKKIMTVEAEVTGTKGTPLNIDLGGPNRGRQLRLEMHDVADTQPPQYFAQFRLVEMKQGRVQKVLAEPALVTVVGRPAKFVSGAEKGDRIEVDLTVNEVAVEKK
jgi:Flp pilus assembly secretin CpaC